jgi:photosystem I subunit PsaN
MNSSFIGLKPAAAAAQATAAASSPMKQQQVQVAPQSRRAALLGLAAVFAVTATTAGSAKAGVFDEYLEKSKANKVDPFFFVCVAIYLSELLLVSVEMKTIQDFDFFFWCGQELNDKKRMATSAANFARAYTVEFGSCQFPYNFTGCQDLAKQKVVRSHDKKKISLKNLDNNNSSFC